RLPRAHLRPHRDPRARPRPLPGAARRLLRLVHTRGLAGAAPDRRDRARRGARRVAPRPAARGPRGRGLRARARARVARGCGLGARRAAAALRRRGWSGGAGSLIPLPLRRSFGERAPGPAWSIAAEPPTRTHPPPPFRPATVTAQAPDPLSRPLRQ